MNGKKPFGSELFIYDGEWVVPYGLLAISTLYWDYEWTKIVLIMMMIISLFHIMYEHRLVIGKKDINTRRAMNLGAAVICFISKFFLPIYVAINYAIFASHLKKEGQETLLSIKKKTYTRMFLILAFAVSIDTIQGLLLIDDIRAAIESQQPAQPGQAGTISN